MQKPKRARSPKAAITPATVPAIQAESLEARSGVSPPEAEGAGVFGILDSLAFDVK